MRITVVGGGLAGMAAALRLRQLGCSVELMEASGRLGGEAGAEQIDGRWEDHGYHVFFPWYLNAFSLIDELGISANLRDNNTYYMLHKNDYPDFSRRWMGMTWKQLVRPQLSGGNLSAANQFLYYYLLLDMMAQDYKDRDESVGDFLRSRWYATPEAISEIHRLVKTSVISPDEHSARSLRQAMAYFARYMRPLYRAPVSNLERAFIGPFRQRLEDRGVEIRMGWRLAAASVRDDRVETMRFETPGGIIDHPVEETVVAIPHHTLAGLDGGALAERAGLAAKGFRQLRSEPLSALHLYFREPIPHLPDEHVRLVDSAYESTFVDLAQSDHSLSGAVLNMCVVAGDLLKLEPAKAAKAIVDEMHTYIPAITWEKVEHFVFQPNTDTPFYSNDVGSWDRRPDAATALRNLWLAGDYVRSPIDIATMENAIVTGYLAADVIRKAHALSQQPVKVIKLKEVTWRQAAAAKTILAPAALLACRLARREKVELRRVALNEHRETATRRNSTSRPERPRTPQELFDRVAPYYDRFNSLLSLGFDRRWRRIAARQLDLAANARVLDLATGTGAMAREIIRRAPQAVSVAGCDLNERMLRVGREKADGAVAFVRAEAGRLPFPDDFFDAATLAFAIDDFPDRQASVRDLRRVLKPGAQLVLLELSLPEQPALRRCYRGVLRVMDLAGRLPGRSGYRHLRQEITGYRGAAAIRELLVKGGFNGYRCRPLTGGIVTLHVARAR